MPRRPRTLMEMQGAPLQPADLANASLVIIDMQEEYRSGGLPLDRIDEAVQETARVLQLARRHGSRIFHVFHEIGPDAPIFNPQSQTFAEIEAVAATRDEEVVVKRLPNAFAGTDLEARLKETGRNEIIVVGAMTHMCVSATVRAALDLGFRSTVVAGACATRDLPAVDGSVLSAAEVHRAALAELADVFAIVVPDAAALQIASAPPG